MNESMRERAARTAGRFVFGLAFLLPLIAGAVAPDVSISQIVATPQTNYNGSAVTATFTGSLVDYTVKLTVGSTSYDGTVSGNTVTFAVPGTAVTAGHVYASTITATKDSVSSTIGGKYLYQGAKILGGGGTNAWFKTWAEGTEVEKTAGTWKTGDVTKDPPAKDSKIVIDADETTDEYVDYVFTPDVQANASQVTVIDMTLSFDAAMDDVVDAADLQSAIRVVTDGDTYRFAALTNGVWTTNTTMAAHLGVAYPLRTTFDYREVPATVTYAVKDNGVYEEIAKGVSGTTKSALKEVVFNGTGKLTQMTGSNIVDSVDASLVKDTEHPANKYANIGAALANNVTNLTLLWNTAWQPTTGLGEFRIAKGDGYNWYYTPENGLLVKLVDGTYVVITDYWEAMNLIFGSNNVTTNTYMFFTNAVISGGETITNLYLLRDVKLDETLKVNRSMTFNGEDRILSGSGLDVANDKTFTIAGGCIDVAQSACSGNVVLQGGRYKTTPGWTAPTGYTFADLAVAVRTDYVKQLMLATKAPTTGQELMPMTDANGESVSVVVNKSWVDDKVSGTPAEQSVELSKVQANGMTRLDNEVLGLTTSGGAVEANNIPVITPVQSSTADKVTFLLGNVNKDTISASGAKVTYRVVTSSKPGGKDGAASSYVAPAAEVQMPLPDTGVQYYLIEVDTGAVK